jgi:outer membrane lipoprotein SlyB
MAAMPVTVRRLAAATLTAAILVLLGACASDGQPRHPLGEAEQEQVRYGRIVKIDSVQIEGDHQLGVGAVIGGVAGALIGGQFGGGSARGIATVLGAVGGAFAGNAVERRYAEARPGQHITVKLDNEVTVGITQPADAALRVGDRVRIAGSGPEARVVRP